MFKTIILSDFYSDFSSISKVEQTLSCDLPGCLPYSIKQQHGRDNCLWNQRHFNSIQEILWQDTLPEKFNLESNYCDWSRNIWTNLLTSAKVTLSKGSPDPSLFIFEINVGKRRIRQRTTLKLNDQFLDRLKIDWRWRHSESFYVGSACFRHWFQKQNGLGLDYYF